MLDLQGAGLKYKNGTWGIRQLDLSVRAGDMIGVIGANGAGKSSTLTLCSGLTGPTEGRVERADGVKYVGWCPQRDLVDWSLTVGQNVRLPLAVLGLSIGDTRRRTAEVLELLDLTSVEDRQVELISGGQLRRVQVARAIATRAQLLVLDEPASGLDPEGTERVYNHLARMAREDGSGVIISSHDLGVLEGVASRVVEIVAGKKAFDGSLVDFIGSREVPAAMVKARFTGDSVAKAIESLHGLHGVLSIDVVSESLQIALTDQQALRGILATLVALPGLEDLLVENVGLRQAYLARNETSGAAPGHD